jgi:hypothetical protein
MWVDSVLKDIVDGKLKINTSIHDTI